MLYLAQNHVQIVWTIQGTRTVASRLKSVMILRGMTGNNLSGMLYEYDINDQLYGSVHHLSEVDEEYFDIFQVSIFDCYHDCVKDSFMLHHTCFHQYKSNEIKKGIITILIHWKMHQV